jgi:class 3 adenylate cyclase/alpha-beta hydrolase superfamily lysophospholipase
VRKRECAAAAAAVGVSQFAGWATVIASVPTFFGSGKTLRGPDARGWARPCDPRQTGRVMEAPETRYVAVGDADVAYQVLGHGSLDVLLCLGLGSHVEILWEQPVFADFIAGLASFSRVILLDRRGTGASDGVPRNAIPTWEDWTEDFDAVLGAVGVERAAVVARDDATRIAMLFAAMHPERVSHLVLINPAARRVWAADYPIGMPPEEVKKVVARVAAGWGKQDFWGVSAPSMVEDAEFGGFHARMQRIAATPRAAAAQYEAALRSDVRQALPMIQAPTLVLHPAAYGPVPFELGRYVAEHIEGAKLIKVPGADYSMTRTNAKLTVEATTEFLTGDRPQVEVDRLLTTVLFTDIVGSTQQVASLGDQAWSDVLEAHDRLVREELHHFRGREINTTGDGFVANFDGPARAIRCAQSIVKKTPTLGIEVRTGLHTGECEVRGGDLGGLAVHIAARVGAAAGSGEVLVSSTVKDLVTGSGIEFQDRGEHDLKGVPGTWRLHAVTG